MLTLALLADASPRTWLLATLSFLVVYLAVASLLDYVRLRHIKGPFLASWTNLPRLGWVVGNNSHDIHIDLHRKYGSIVRFGPNMVSIADPAEIPRVYGIDGKFVKSDFYRVLLFFANGKPVPTIFATQDEHLHRALKRPISSKYAMTNVVSFESRVDSTILYFFQRLKEDFVFNPAPLNFGLWLQMFAFDVIGEITFSRRLGFLERGEDVEGVMESIWQYFKKASPVTQMSWLDRIWAKNPIYQRLQTFKPNAVVQFGIDRVNERRAEAKLSDGKGEPAAPLRDFLQCFMEILEKDPSIPSFALTAWTTSNVTAGSDTTAIFLRTTFYNLLRNPQVLAKLRAELDTAAREGRLSRPVTWKETRALPYLDAVIKESGRIHPPFGLPLERVVPVGGATVCGKFLPEGTIVGMSGWTVHRDKATFGDDCDEWNPERWLCEPDRKRRMENALMTFGAGLRTCLGKHISNLEIYKLVPSFLQEFEIEFADAAQTDWHVENRWFVNQTGFNVNLKPRGEVTDQVA